MRVVAFNGSARRSGNTAILLEAVLEEVRAEGIATEVVPLAGKPLGGCIACYKCFENKNFRCAVEADEMNSYVQKMLDADGIILGSPTYFSDVTASMKALIERCGMVARANNDMLRYKVGAAVVAVRRAGATHVFSSINYFFLISQMIVPGSSYWNLAIGRNPGDVRDDSEGMQTMVNLGKNVAWLMKKLQG